MTVHTILQAVCLFIIYTVLTVVLPELVFHQKYKGRRTGERLMLDITVSNFYIMNLVFILQLLHISSIYTLLIFTVMPVFAVIIIQYRKAFKAWGIRQLALLGKISSKTMGIKTFFAIVFTRIKDILCNTCKNIFHIIGRHKTEYVLFTLLSVWLLYIYGSNEILQYGYTVSDLPVHNYWINEMSKNNIFAAGVYPFGFHCIIYYIHTVFHIDTYVILRLFSVVQTFYLHLVLFTFIRSICRSSFAAYGGLFLYLVPSLYHGNCTIRFISALPQEYGMLFILPCIYFLFAFFKDMKENAGKWIICTDLAAACACFSMTIAVHFYDTMIAGLFCAAIVIGFCVRFFRPRYFLRLMGAVLLAVVIGVLPMFTAALCGKPMQGSIGWGINILTGRSSSGINQNQDSNENKANTSSSGSSQIALPDTTKEEVTPEPENLAQDIDTEPVLTPSVSTLEKTTHFLQHFYQTLSNDIQEDIFAQDGALFAAVILSLCALIVFAGIGMCIAKQPDYGFIQISTGIFLLFLLILFNAKNIGLPQLMDQNRSRIYLTYMLTVLYALVLDLPAGIVLYSCKKPRAANGISLILSGIICAAACMVFPIRSHILAPRVSILETNGAITCLGQILSERRNTTFTVVSANDELQMLAGRGQHYETITFLRYLKYAAQGQRIIIPTKYVYFYIEKIPLDYTVSYADSGQSISRTGAANTLPSSAGINPYKGENRWIVMSKMYYWAEQFRKLFPQDMTVYYEDDEFICYRLIQNESSPFSLSIDYNYNQ